MTVALGDHSTSAGIQHTHNLVLACGGKVGSIIAEGHAVDGVSVGAKIAEQLSGADVPHEDLASQNDNKG